MDDVTALILAGGAGRRLGRDKLHLPVGDRQMLRWMIDAGTSVAGRVVLSVRDEVSVADMVADLPVIVICDTEPGSGPAAGMRDALDAVRTPFVLTLGCDTPLVQVSLLRLILERLRATPADVTGVVPVVDDHLQPLLSGWRTSALSTLAARAHASGTRSLRGMLEGTSMVRLDEATCRTVDPHLDSFRNVNDEAGLQDVMRRIAALTADGHRPT